MSDNESSDNTTAFEVTDAPLSMAVVESEKSPYDNATASGGADEFALISYFIFIFHLFREGCPSTEVVFQGALQLKTNYNIQ